MAFAWNSTLGTRNALAKGPGTSSANFLKIGVGGRAVAMGETQTAAVNDVMALYWNPAGLGRLNQKEAALQHNDFFQGISQDVLYFAHPTSRFGTLGAGLSLLRVGDIAGFDMGGAPTQDLTASDSLYTVGWGKAWENLGVLSDLHTGVNLKFLQKKLGGDSGSTAMADLGLLYAPRAGLFSRFRTGLTFQNLGGSVNFVSEDSDLPQLTRFGVAVPLYGDSLTLAADAVSPSDNDLYLNLGMEYRLWNILAFRVGYKGQNDLDSGLTYGVGFGNERLHLDYAFVPFGDLGNTHRVSLGVRFGPTYRLNHVQSQIGEAYREAETRYAQGHLVDAYFQASQIVDVAPWHDPSKGLLQRIQQEFQELENIARKEQLQMQIDEHFSRGEQHFMMDELVPARQEFETILALQPNHPGARTYLRRIDERFKSLIQNFYDTAMRAFSAGDYPQAKEFFEKVLVVQPDHAEAQEQMERVKRLMDEAQKAAEKRARMEMVRPIYQSGTAAFQKKDYEAALEKFEQILQIDPENTEAKRYEIISRDILTREAFEAGQKAVQESRWSQANEQFRRALKFRPDFKEAQEALGKVRSQMGEQRKVESQKMYKDGLEAFLSGDQQKAQGLWQKALDIDPDNLEAKRGLERITPSRKGNGTN